MRDRSTVTDKRNSFSARECLPMFPRAVELPKLVARDDLRHQAIPISLVPQPKSGRRIVDVIDTDALVQPFNRRISKL